MNFEPGEIVVAPFSFKGQKNITKDRYLLVISKYSKNPIYDTFVCLPITSVEENHPYIIKIMAQDLQYGKLMKPSQVICHAVYILEKKDAIRLAGKVTPQFYAKIKNVLKEHILDI
ncbi:MAG: type II toxin-antitoxin system PemK/MazF family toxin [Nitrosopumilaceae archaeon]